MAGWARTDNHGTRRSTQGGTRPPRARRTRLAAIVLIALLVALLPGQVARAATTFAVDFVAGTDSLTCGVTPNPACKTIAFTIASRASNGDTLTIAGLQFNEDTITISKSVTINGAGASTTVIHRTGVGDGRVLSVGAGLTVTITGVTITNGFAPTLVGGGITNNGILTATNSAVQNNRADVTGGGIDNNGTLTMTGSTVSNNTSSGTHPGGGGGGIFNEPGTSLTMTNSTISGNTAVDFGGGLFNNGGTAMLTNVTVASNGALSGINTDSGGSTTLKNTIVANNTRANCGGPITDGGYNFDSAATCGFAAANHSLINADPKLGPLTNNGGPTFTHALMAGSAAIDAGGTSANGCPATDQRGVTRPQGAACDIGAFEATAVAATLMSIAVTPTNPSIAVGATQQFTAIGTYSDNHTANITSSVTWSSSTPATATINAAGLATGVAAGGTSIIATSGSISGATTLTVSATAPKASLSVDRTRVPFDENTVTLSYNAAGPVESVCVSANGAAAQQVAKTGSGEAGKVFSAIQSGSYVFTLNQSTTDCTGATDPSVAPITVVKLTPDGTTNPSITATPTTLPVVSGVVKPSSTIKFGSGTGASALVCLSVNGGTQQLYSFATFNSQLVDWTQSGTYAFRLYTNLPAGTNCATQAVATAAASVTVTAQAGLVVNPTTATGGSAPGGASVLVTGNSGSGAPVLACVAVPGGQSQPIVVGNSGILNGPLSPLGVGSFVVTIYQSTDGTTPITTFAAAPGQCTANTPLKVVPGVAPVTVTVTA